jgi:hypothetical protein
MKILLGTFKENAEELSAFLEPRLGTKPSVNGAELTVDDDSIKDTVRSRHVKTYIKRFLSHKGKRKNYRVLVEGKELRLIELEGGAEAKEEEEKERKKEEAEKEKKKQEAKGPKKGEAAELESKPEQDEEEEEEGAATKQSPSTP